MFYDVIILGNGSQARRAALQLARAGRSVAIVQDELNSAELDANELNRWLHCGDTESHWTPACRLFQQEFEQANHASSHWLRQFDVDIHQGTVQFVTTDSILVSGIEGDTLLNAEHLVIASGEESRIRVVSPVDSRYFITPDDLVAGVELPNRIAVVYENRESHGRWNCLSKYTSVVSQLAGWKQVISVTESSTGRLIVRTKQQGTFVVDAVVTDDAQAKTAGMGLKETGLNIGPGGHVICDEHLATNVSGIYGLGAVVHFEGREPDGDHVQILVDRILTPEPALEEFSELDFQSLKLVTF